MIRSLAILCVLMTLNIGPGAARPSSQKVTDGAIRPQDEPTGTPAELDPQATAALTETLSRAIREGWQDLHLQVRCPAPAQSDTLEVLAGGVGVWNFERQIALSTEVVREMLSVLRDADFPAMAASYGGKAKPLKAPDRIPPAGAEIACQIALELDGLSKTVIQMRKGDQSAKLRQLAESLLNLARPFVDRGLTAEDLDDALAKLAAGKLAPELLAVSLHRKPMGDDEGKEFVLSVRRTMAESRSAPDATGKVTITRLPLGDERIRQLAALLKKSNLEEMPLNLWAEVYTTLGAGVMRWRKSIQARQFSGMSPSERDTQQKVFEKIVAELEKLHAQVLSQGVSTETPPATR